MVVMLRRLNERTKRRTHPTNILEKRTNNPILEALIVELGPVDSLWVILWEVMNTALKELVLLTREQDIQRTQRNMVWYLHHPERQQGG